MNELKELINIFSEIDDPQTMLQLFEELFTEAERKDFASRWGLMKDLKAGMSQRKIAKARHISLCKITRGSKLLKNGSSISGMMIDKHTESNTP